MPNMAYCRFRNAYRDLVECKENIFDSELSEIEKKYRTLLILKCQEIVGDSLDFNPGMEILTEEEKQRIRDEYS